MRLREELARQAEQQRLARLLNLSEAELDFLLRLDAQSLRQLRQQTETMLHDSDRELLQALASTAQRLPVSLIALLAEKSLGALLCARIAALLPNSTASAVARRLPSPLLAEVCVLLDPRRLRELAPGIPAAQILAVSLALAQRREYATMALFVDMLDVSILAGVIPQLSDDAALIRIAAYVEDRQRLNALIALLPAPRRAGIIEAALADNGALWPAALSLIGELDARWQREFGELALRREPAQLLEMIRISDEAGLLAQLIGIGTAAEDEAALRGLQQALAQLEPLVFKRLLGATQNQAPPAP
ncbi:hypothetical protein SAMN04488038_10641 [Solimonas aquatica]|uniref:Uncharacterized protein n=1 Tax=Solimonas aquatica TaxID=489703 RepID=A0A1H9FPI9_9GAMM|nr:hypothetical protein [Solimonas aquatica]SEQ39403.1 hypothetical protein SAMN04488038_10641 [Solimonas aquatica]